MGCICVHFVPYFVIFLKINKRQLNKYVYNELRKQEVFEIILRYFLRKFVYLNSKI
jgi:hypothetical protein